MEWKKTRTKTRAKQSKKKQKNKKASKDLKPKKEEQSRKKGLSGRHSTFEEKIKTTNISNSNNAKK